LDLRQKDRRVNSRAKELKKDDDGLIKRAQRGKPDEDGRGKLTLSSKLA
jgi:hypothetical protein